MRVQEVYWVNKPVREQKPAGMGCPGPATFWVRAPFWSPSSRRIPRSHVRAASRTTLRFLRVQKVSFQLHGALGSELLAQHSCSADVNESVNGHSMAGLRHAQPLYLPVFPSWAPPLISSYTFPLPSPEHRQTLFILNLSSYWSFSFLLLTETGPHPTGTASPTALTSGSHFSYTPPPNGPRAAISSLLTPHFLTEGLTLLPAFKSQAPLGLLPSDTPTRILTGSSHLPTRSHPILSPEMLVPGWLSPLTLPRS